ncbi:MAG TPA: DUF6249 domain-containing protein [Thermoanaerobaculia bacterium]|jgi:hypothetical protein|nr:DUF6249 domain-containing protein [Thermoanaerobaculia bacterium]
MTIAIFLAATMVSVFSFVSITAFADQRRRERDAFYRNELLKKLAESPADQAQRVLDVLREKDLAAERLQREGMKLGGLVVTAVGLGLMAMLKLMAPNDQAWAVGLIPLLIGVVLLVHTYGIGSKAGKSQVTKL